MWSAVAAELERHLPTALIAAEEFACAGGYGVGTGGGRSALPRGLAMSFAHAVTWRDHVRSDPLPWLLEEETPAVRAAALRRLCDASYDAGDVRAARAAAMRIDPIKTILDHQDSAGWWVKPGPGYATKYRSSVWSIIFLDQFGADPRHPQVVKGVDYLLAMTATSAGGLRMLRCEGGATPAAVNGDPLHQRQPSASVHRVRSPRRLTGAGRGGLGRAGHHWGAR